MRLVTRTHPITIKMHGLHHLSELAVPYKIGDFVGAVADGKSKLTNQPQLVGNPQS